MSDLVIPGELKKALAARPAAQAAFNALEVAMWRQVVSGEHDVDLVEAVGLLSTVLGFGNDTLARQYVSLASKRHVTSLDMSALFRGTNS